MSLDLKEIDVNELSGNNPFVSKEWATIKQHNGWSSLAFIIMIDDLQYEMLVLIKNIKFGFLLAYAPFSPVPLNGSLLTPLYDNFSEMSKKLVYLLPKKVFVIRYDLPFNYSGINSKFDFDVFKKGFRVKKQSVQPVSTTFIDLSEDLSAIQMNYRKRAKRFLKKNKDFVSIDIWDGSFDDLSKWYSVYKKTGVLDGFTTRSFSYVEKTMANDNCMLLLSRVDNEIVGGIIILLGNDVAIYLLGGSLKDCGFSVSYSLQDFAIRLCKKKGIKYYDLFGIGDDKSKHLLSLNLFKNSFGGKNITRISTFDFITKPISYSLFNIAEFTRYLFYR